MRSNVSRARQHEPLRLYLTAQTAQDDAPVVGVERCPGSQVHRCSHVVRRHERTQAEMPDAQPPVVGARCPLDGLFAGGGEILR